MRRVSWFILGLLIMLAACAAPAPVTPTPPLPTGIARPVQATRELVVGANRFVFGLVDSGTGQPIEDVAQVKIQFFKVHDDGNATKVGDADVVYRDENLPAGLYVARTEFDAPGAWGALMSITPAAGEPYQVKADFQVAADSPVPNAGELPPASKNMVERDVAMLIQICSAVPLDTMHEQTIAAAMASGKPTLILFATPGYCESRMCGPDLQVAQALQARYGEQANYIHIETPSHTHDTTVGAEHYTQEGHGGVANPQIETMNEWGLQSEPWIFLLDKQGKVAERFEGGLTLDEVEPAFAALLR